MINTIFKVLAFIYANFCINILTFMFSINVVWLGLPLFGIFVNGKLIKQHSGALNKVKLQEFVQKGLQ